MRPSYFKRIAVGAMTGAIVAGVLMSAPIVAAEDAATMFHDLYGRELTAARATPSHDDDVALAQRLMAVAQDTKTPPAMIVELCEHAYELTHKDRTGLPVAQRAMQLLAVILDHRVEACTHLAELAQVQLLQSRGAERAEAAATLVQALQHLADAQQQAGQTDAAITTPSRP